MKKIYIKENSISNILRNRLLPKFLFKMIKDHTTSLGDCEMFPIGDEYPFEYILLKKRYNEVCDNIEQIGLETLDEEYLVSVLSSLVKECKKLETPIRDSLERLCENAVNRLFAIPDEMLNFEFKLVDKVTFKNRVRMKPESNGEVHYTFKDLSDIEMSNKAVSKRRFINSLIQGAAYNYASYDELYIDELNALNPKLPWLYDKIKVINDYLLFVKKEDMTDDKPMQGSYVEVKLGVGDNKSSIKAQGLIFPLLLQESIKGLFEMFSSHGLPNDRARAEYVIKKSDFVLAEPWDLRFGVGLWNSIFGEIEDTNIIPYVFTRFVKLSTDKFNDIIKEILSSTEKGGKIINMLVDDASYDNGYQEFTNRINAKRLDKSIIKDSYFTGAETNGYEIDSEDEENDMLEEFVDENTSKNKSVLIESQESKSISAAKKLLMQRLEYSEEAADEFVRVKLRTDIPSLRTPQGGKFILGVTRMFCDHELNSANVIGRLNNTIKYVASDTHINEYDRNLNGMSAKDLIDRFSANFEQDLQKDKDELSTMSFETNNDYQIVRIDSFEQAHQYSQYTTWCVTHDSTMFKAYTNNGIAQFYFCLKNGFEQIEETTSSNSPLDEYGLSMLAVCVDEDGSLKTCTCRWNHSNGGNDNIMDTKGISKVIGQNFYNVFKPNNVWKEKLAIIIKRLEEGEHIRNIFISREEFGWLGDYVYATKVSLEGKYNILLQDISDGSFKFASDHWFDYISDLHKEGVMIVERGDKYNLMTLEGRFISSVWYDYIDRVTEGFAQISLDGKDNFLRMDGTLLLDKWVDNSEYFTDGYAQVSVGDKWNYVGTDGDILSEEWFDLTKWFKDGFGAVEKNGQWNYIDQFGEILSKDMWFDNCADFRYHYGLVRKDWRYNLIGEDGRLLSDVWFDNFNQYASPINGHIGYGQLDGRTYYFAEDGTIYDSYGDKVNKIYQ